MAEIKEGILGGVHGSVGPVVGFRWRGRYFLRSKPRKSNKPASVLQLLQRSKMGLISTFASKIKDFVNAHYPPALLNGQMATGKEQLISMLMSEGVVVIDGVACIDIESVLLSIGTLPPAVIRKINRLKTGRIKVLWDNSITNIMTKNTDRLTMVAYNEIDNAFIEIASIGKREDKYVHFDLPEEWNKGNIHFWSVWKSADGKWMSTSAYHGIVALDNEGLEKMDVTSDSTEIIEPQIAVEEVANAEQTASKIEDSKATKVIAILSPLESGAKSVVLPVDGVPTKVEQDKETENSDRVVGRTKLQSSASRAIAVVQSDQDCAVKEGMSTSVYTPFLKGVQTSYRWNS